MHFHLNAIFMLYRQQSLNGTAAFQSITVSFG
jgi:hypothetical protein